MVTPRDVAGTRRDSPLPAGATRHDLAVPAQTRRDEPGGPPDGPAATRRDGGGAGGVPGVPPLPPDVAGRYRVVEMLARQGAEADVYLVVGQYGAGQYGAGQDAAQAVLKVYRREVEPDAEVWAALPRARSRHLVVVHETGTTLDGRKFEIMEHLGGGDLRGVAARGPLDGAALRGVVEQLTDGLSALHALQIVHRDLKPENVLLRAGYSLELVLTDFGLSRRLDQTSAYSTAARTLLYTAPETFSGHVSPARDWWSLGMIVRELATGKRPFPGWTEAVIMNHLITRPIDLSEVTDPRVALLCRGLLVRDHGDRWGAAQVRDWLAGGAPPVVDDRPVPAGPGPRPIRVFGAEPADPPALAATLEQHWEDAARTFFALRESERWRALKGWLGRFDDTDFYAGEDRQDLCDRLDGGAWLPDVKLVQLLTLLDPARPPRFRGVPLRPADLPGLAVRAANGDAEATRTVADLWQTALLPMLAHRSGAAELAGIDARWRSGFSAYERAVADAVQFVPHLGVPLAEPAVRTQGLAATLRLAASGADAGQALLAAVHEQAGRLPRPVEWFHRLVTGLDGDPARSLAVLAALPVARAEAEQQVRAEQQEQARLHARRQQWEQMEADRLAGRGGAIGYALGGAAVLLGIWFVFLFVAGGRSADAVLLVLSLQTVVEIGLAVLTGRDYHPRFSLLRGTGRAAGGVGGSLRSRPAVGCLGIVVLLFGLPYFTYYYPWVVPALAAVVHVGWAVHRGNAWSQDHDRRRLEVLR